MMLEIEAEALMEEYRSLRSEIGQRVQNQLYIIGGNLALISALLGILAKSFCIQNLTFILLTPMVFFAITWLYFEQDVFLTQAATYLHQHLRPIILRRIAEEAAGTEGELVIMEWEKFRNEVLFRRTRNRVFLQLMVIFRLFATLGPGAAILCGAVYLALSEPCNLDQIGWIEYALFGFDIVWFGFLCYQYQYVLRLYSEIAEPES